LGGKKGVDLGVEFGLGFDFDLGFVVEQRFEKGD
jgi:hypothetical protein